MDNQAELLLTLAEVSVAFAGFASITVLFRRRSAGEWGTRDALRYRAMLRASLFACLFSVLPVLVFRAGASEAVAWSLASAGLIGYVSWISSVFIFLYRVRARLSAEILLTALGAALVAILQLLNLVGVAFHREAAPVLLGVGVLLVNSGVNFYHLVAVHPTAQEPPATE